jgi:hypothetical protein
MEKLFASWRTEISVELAEAAVERDAALLEQDEAQRAEAVARADLVEVEAALGALERRIEAEQLVEARSVAVLRAAPAPLAMALRGRLDDLRNVARAAFSRTAAATRTVNQANSRIADLRHGLEQLELIADAGRISDAA